MKIQVNTKIHQQKCNFFEMNGFEVTLTSGGQIQVWEKEFFKSVLSLRHYPKLKHIGLNSAMILNTGELT